MCLRSKKANLTQNKRKNTPFFLANPEKRRTFGALIKIHKEI